MPTPIILNGNNSALGSLAGGAGNMLNSWADAYATQVIQEQYKKRNSKTAQDKYSKMSESEKSMYQLVPDANGYYSIQPIETKEVKEEWKPTVLPYDLGGYPKGTHVLASNKNNIKLDKDWYDVQKQQEELALKKKESVTKQVEGIRQKIIEAEEETPEQQDARKLSQLEKELKLRSQYKTDGGSTTDATTQVTIYGPDGQTKKVPISKEQEYVPPSGWSLNAPNASAEKNDLQTEITVNEIRSSLVDKDNDRQYFDSNAPLFNKRNGNNEVAYWDDSDKGKVFNRQGKAKVMQLPKEAIDLGWTPSKIEDAAKTKGKTVRQVLVDLGIIK